MRDHVLSICTAYEQGYGHGYDIRGTANPYGKGSDEWQAWGYGYDEGHRARVKMEENISESLRQKD